MRYQHIDSSVNAQFPNNDHQNVGEHFQHVVVDIVAAFF